MHLQEAYSQADDTVTSQASGEHLVHASLAQEGLDDQDETAKSRKFGKKPLDHLTSCDSVNLVDANVDGEAAMSRYEFDNGDLRFRDNGNFVRDSSSLDRVRQGV